MDSQIYYRYDITKTELNATICLQACKTEFSVTKITPKGAWIDGLGGKRFILNRSASKYAWPTKELAWESFLKRKESQIKTLRKQLAAAEKSLLFRQRDCDLLYCLFVYPGEYNRPFLPTRQSTRIDILTGLEEVV